MRTLHADLEAMQKKVGVTSGNYPGLWKIVLSRAGQATKTYTGGSAALASHRIYKVVHIETEESQVANVLLDNFDGALTSLDFEVYQGIISYGFTTSGPTDRYSATAPLKVVSQDFVSIQGKLLLSLYLIGPSNLLASELAEEIYIQTEANPETYKTLIDDIADTTLISNAYANYPAHTITWDSEDGIVDTYAPADLFNVQLNDSRLAKILELLLPTQMVFRPEDDGLFHFFDPVISGATYDYEYKLNVVDDHTFIAKSLRKRFVSPNKIVVKSHPAHNPTGGQYTGNHTNATSFALLPLTETHYFRLLSDAQAAAIAQAMMTRIEVNMSVGTITVPMNVGGEVHDYVKVTDSRESTSMTGNVGFLMRTCEGTRFEMQISLGKQQANPRGILIPEASLAAFDVGIADVTDLAGILQAVVAQLEEGKREMVQVQASLRNFLEVWLVSFQNEGWFRKLTVTEELTIPVQE